MGKAALLKRQKQPTVPVADLGAHKTVPISLTVLFLKGKYQ
jgi:hypothetical protein